MASSIPSATADGFHALRLSRAVTWYSVLGTSVPSAFRADASHVFAFHSLTSQTAVSISQTTINCSSVRTGSWVVNSRLADSPDSDHSLRVGGSTAGVGTGAGTGSPPPSGMRFRTT
jgi:hypothetical protein